VGEKYSRKELAMVQLAPHKYSIIIGLLLSDGWLTFSNFRSQNARLGFKQSLSHSAYVWFVFNELTRAPALPAAASRRPRVIIVAVILF
jgi:hypothetical protein